MTTWAQPIRHPWFNPPTMKRKLCHSDDDDGASSSDVPAATFSTGRRKRARCNSLERTLAHMTLTTSEDVDMWPKISLPRPHEQETLAVTLPSSVEEPDMPASEPVDMEVEPTLVTTDTPATTLPPHGVHDWESIASGELDIKEVQISSAVLECLRRQTKCPPAPIPLPSQTSLALVLYRPPGPPSSERAYDHQEEQPSQTSNLVVHEDDAMEVE
ncbi:hypothetical protein HD554DRAFT_2040937 [Boletus coccyginus]|nr:hypothetical protein HD554DRAFT_2040937 [Boletus coccyginus]